MFVSVIKHLAMANVRLCAHARVLHSITKTMLHRMDAENVSILRNKFTNSRMMRQHFYSDESSLAQPPHREWVSENGRTELLTKNYAMHVFNRNKNNYIFVVSTMIRCVNTRFAALVWALMRFDFSFWIVFELESKRFAIVPRHRRIQMKAKNFLHFFFSFLLVFSALCWLFIHRQFCQRIDSVIASLHK